jgi:hypothetical protein
MERTAAADQLDRFGELLPRAAEEFERLKRTLAHDGWLWLMIVAMSRFRVKNDRERDVRQAFLDRPRLVDDQAGFLGLEVFQDQRRLCGLLSGHPLVRCFLVSNLALQPGASSLA